MILTSRDISRSRMWLVALILSALIGSPEAQVNIEKMRKEGGEEGLSGAALFDLRVRSGNVDVWEFNLESQIGMIRRQRSFLLISRGELEWKDGERYSNEGLLHLRHVIRSRERFRPECFAQIDYNKARSLEFRGLVGGGLRTNLYRTEATQIWWGTAYMLEHERLEASSAIGADRVVTVHRWSNYLNIKIDIDGHARGMLTLYAQPRFTAWGDVRVLGDARLEADLIGPLSLSLSGNARYDSRPPAAVDDLDLRLGSGLGIEF